MTNHTSQLAPNLPTTAERLAAGLRRHGITNIFAQSIPASLLLAAPDAGIRQIGYRAENAGGVMADGYARVSRQIAAVCAQNGPAATLLVPPLAEALKASVPIIALVEEIPLAERGRNAFQEFDHRGLFSAVAKWIGEVSCAERLDDVLDFAVTMATSGRPGPVVLLLPRDILSQRVAQTAPRDVSLGEFPLDRCVPTNDALTKAASLIAAAERPLVVAGGGVHLSGGAAEIEKLAGTWGLPVATTNMGKGSIAETHPLSVGVFGNCMGAGTAAGQLRDYVTEADVILIVGSRTNQNGTDTWTLFPKDAKIIHIDMDAAEIGRNYQSIRLAGDARETLSALNEALDRNPPDSEEVAKRAAAIAERTRSAREFQVRAISEIGNGRENAIRPEALMRAIDARFGETDIFVADASYSNNWMCTYLQARQSGQRFITPRGLAGLGWGVPLAMGAKLAAPDSRVMVMVGDGGFGHCWAELETIMRMGIDVKIVVLNNGILGFQKHGECAFYGKHSDACNFTDVDHAEIARACGMNAASLEKPENIESAIAQWMNSDGPMLLDVRTDDLARPPLTLLDGRNIDAPVHAMEHV